MKSFIHVFIGSCVPFLFCLAVGAQTEIPEYSSTFNTGLGKQQRLNAVEDQLMVLTKAQKADQKKLYEQMPSQEEFEQMNKDLQRSQNQIKELNEKIQQLERQNVELEQKLARVDGTELREMLSFIRPLKEGGMDKIKQEIEGLKLTIRSMEAVIESMHKESP